MLRTLALAALLVALAALLADGVAAAIDRDCCAAARVGDECGMGCTACVRCTQVPTALPELPQAWQPVRIAPCAELRSAGDPESVTSAGIFHPPRSAVA